MASKSKARNRRAADLSLLAPQAPVMMTGTASTWGQGIYETISLTLWQVPATGSFEASTLAITDVTGITGAGNPCLGAWNLGGNLIIAFAPGSFEFGGVLEIPTWFEGIRGPSGEWISPLRQEFPAPTAFGYGWVDLADTDPAQADPSLELSWEETTGGGPMLFDVTGIPPILKNSVPPLSATNPDGDTLVLTWPTLIAAGDVITIPANLSQLDFSGPINAGRVLVVPVRLFTSEVNAVDGKLEIAWENPDGVDNYPMIVTGIPPITVNGNLPTAWEYDEETKTLVLTYAVAVADGDEWVVPKNAANITGIGGQGTAAESGEL